MATKNYCDIPNCGAEIKPGSEVGGIMRNKRIYPFAGNAKDISSTSQLVSEAMDLCEDCQKKVWEFALSVKEVKKDGKEKV